MLRNVKPKSTASKKTCVKSLLSKRHEISINFDKFWYRWQKAKMRQSTAVLNADVAWNAFAPFFRNGLAVFRIVAEFGEGFNGCVDLACGACDEQRAEAFNRRDRRRPRPAAWQQNGHGNLLRRLLHRLSILLHQHLRRPYHHHVPGTGRERTGRRRTRQKPGKFPDFFLVVLFAVYYAAVLIGVLKAVCTSVIYGLINRELRKIKLSVSVPSIGVTDLLTCSLKVKGQAVMCDVRNLEKSCVNVYLGLQLPDCTLTGQLLYTPWPTQ